MNIEKQSFITKRKKKTQAEITAKRLITLRANKAAKKLALEQAQSELQALEAKRQAVLGQNLLDKQIEMAALWQDTLEICKAVIADAKLNPLECSASKLQVVLRMLEKGTKQLERLEILQLRQDELKDRGEDGLTEDERDMIKHFNENFEGSSASQGR